jgi:signal peptidase II
MLIAALVAAVVAIIDQLFKMWIVQSIELGGQMALIPKVIHLTYVKNTGAAFSLMDDMPTLLLIITGICIIGIIIFISMAKLNTFGKITAGLILGGAIGNVIDRILFGYVVDMFEVEFMEYAVFNIADCCIVIGGILFCVYYIFFNKKSKVGGQSKTASKTNLPSSIDCMPSEPVIEHISISQPPVENTDTDVSAHYDIDIAETEDIKTDWTETEILEEYSLDQILKDYYDKMD